MKKKVLIVIPTYNGERHIRETIESCLSQSYKNISIIVIDDGSTDSTKSILKEFKNKIQIIINENNLGLPKSINKAVLNHQSDFFIYLGHDDLLPANHVEIIMKEFSPEIVAVHCNSTEINDRGEVFSFTKNNFEQFYKTNNIMHELSLNNFISVIGMMIRTSTFKEIKGWEEYYNLFGEWLLYIKLANNGKFKYTDNTYAYYRKHDNNISKTLYSKSKLKDFYLYKQKCRKLAFRYNNLNLLKIVKFKYYYYRDFLKYLKYLIIAK